MSQPENNPDLNISNIESFLKEDARRFEGAYNEQIHYTSKVNDFEKKALIGFGNIGRIYLVQEIKSKRYYALKQLRKKTIMDQNQVEHVKNEKRILQAIKFPCLVRSHSFYTDENCIYFLLPFLIGGDMFTLLQEKKQFSEPFSKFYAAQVVLGLEYLHFMNVIYRDLKLENILIDEIGYIKLTDYGFSKILYGRTFTICGTPEYFAPEIVLNEGYDFAVDWWALGIIIFEFVNGSSPFENEDEMVLFKNIVSTTYTMPSTFSESLQTLIKNLLEVDKTKRLGNLMGGVGDIKHHEWFETIEWLQILNHHVTAPYVPEVQGPSDTSHFDPHVNENDSFDSENEFALDFVSF